LNNKLFKHGKNQRNKCEIENYIREIETNDFVLILNKNKNRLRGKIK
jgi:hypothetical protein